VDHQKRVAKFNKKAKFTEVVTIIADRHVPFSLLSQVMYTAGQAQFSKFKFAVIKRSPT
jgi:biopolymer transport protein ExbD